MSAVLAALTGASWKEIAKDYEQTSKAGFMEYRNKILLAYSFEHILGKHPQKVKDLSSELSECFIQKGILTQKEIETLQKKLSS